MAPPEKGGYDSHSQALGLVYACEYDAMVADDALRQEMQPLLDKAFAWLLARIKGDGTVDATGNTRTGLSQEAARSGKPRGIEYRHVVRSLAHGSQITHNAGLESTARRVFEADRESQPREQATCRAIMKHTLEPATPPRHVTSPTCPG